MFDPICRELAEHFLPDADEAVLDAFAEDMQFQVELWCSHDPRSPECEPEEAPREFWVNPEGTVCVDFNPGPQYIHVREVMEDS